MRYSRKIIRIPAFLLYMVINIPLYLFPVIMSQMCRETRFLNMSSNIAIGIPLSVNMFGILLMSAFTSRILKKLGIKKSIILSFLIVAVSFGVGAFIYDPYVFVFTAFALGCGTGIAYIAMFEFINAAEKYEDENISTTECISIYNAGIFAGANCGVVFGSLLYSVFNYKVVFVTAALISVLSTIFVYCYIDNLEKDVNKTYEAGSVNLIKYLLDYRVWSFGLFIIIPVSIIYFFVVHFIPVFFDAEGASADFASLLYLLNGLVIVYLSPYITGRLTSKFGFKKSAVWSLVFTVIPIILYAVFPSIYMTIPAAIAIGITEGFGQPSRIDYFCALDISQKYGETDALGVYNVIEGIAQIIAPYVYGIIIAVGLHKGMFMLAGYIFISYLIFMFVGKVKEKKC